METHAIIEDHKQFRSQEEIKIKKKWNKKLFFIIISSPHGEYITNLQKYWPTTVPDDVLNREEKNSLNVVGVIYTPFLFVRLFCLVNVKKIKGGGVTPWWMLSSWNFRLQYSSWLFTINNIRFLLGGSKRSIINSTFIGTIAPSFFLFRFLCKSAGIECLETSVCHWFL